MTLLEIEDGLVARLQQVLPSYRVEPYQDDPLSYPLLHQQGAVLVRFDGGVYGPSLDMSLVAQERRTSWELTVMARNLRSHGGLYAMLDAVRMGLTGHAVPGCGKAYPVKELFLGEENKRWLYAMWIAIPVVNVEAAEPETGPLITRINATDNHGQTTEVE